MEWLVEPGQAPANACPFLCTDLCFINGCGLCFIYIYETPLNC